MFGNARRVGGVLTLFVTIVWAAGCGTIPGVPAGTGLPGVDGDQGPQGPQGAQGDAGPQGPAGPQGSVGNDGLNAGSALPKTIVTIASVNGGSPVTIGSAFSVVFTIEDDAGNTIPLNDIDRFSIYVSGPSDDYQRVIVPQSSKTPITQNPDGSYAYAFTAFPSTNAVPANATTGGGAAVTSGTYTVGIEARRSFIVEAQTIRKAGDATADFRVGSAGALAHREVVTQAACEKCHVQLTLHGSNRFKVTGCVLCHTTGAEDMPSTDPAKATPGLTIQLADMIHRLHRGAELPRVKATVNSADPYHYEVIGFGQSVNDFSDVEFPFMPGGTGFNEQTRNCQACHGGAAQESLTHADASITQANCRTCHDDIDFTAGTILDQANASVVAGTLTEAQLTNPAFRAAPNGVPHQFPDGACQFCHGDGRVDSVATLHVPQLSRAANINGIHVTITSVTGASGAGFFLAGDFPVVTFNILDGSNNSINMTDVASLNLVLSGPVENYQKVFPTSPTSSTVSLKGAGGVPTTGTGPFTYTSPTAIPANYPAPASDSTAFTYAGGWGEMSGRPLVAGSYTLMVYAYRNVTVGTVTYREVSPPGLVPIRIGSAGTAASYPGYVTDAKCNACHGDLRFHGNGRKGVAGCVLCHVAGAEDRPNVLAGQTQDPAPDTIDFKVMIHKIHSARELSVVQGGGKYDLVGFASGAPAGTGSVSDFSTAFTPVMPNGPANCAACHATDAWKTPVERTDVNIWKVACTSCHDSAATAVHVALNTLANGTGGEPGLESCATCHGAGQAFSVESMHATP
jgi:OmcA/MtrC family decaheme c-type cytochrome